MTSANWTSLLLSHSAPASETWLAVAAALRDLALAADGPDDLQAETVLPDRLLAEAAFGLWDAFPASAPHTSARLRDWCAAPPLAGASGKAVLVLDALSLREMWLLSDEARRRGIAPAALDVSFSEAPPDTNAFAAALGASSRAALKDDGKTSSFRLFGGNCFTDVSDLPFADVPVPPIPNLVLWHSDLDDRIHAAGSKTVSDVFRQTTRLFCDDGFWAFVDRLRTGRQLVITSDHGYADAAKFSTEIREPLEALAFLRENFHGQRFARMAPPDRHFLPPLFASRDGVCMVTGQRKWPVQGGFPKICHGGLSLLEVASPWIELPPK